MIIESTGVSPNGRLYSNDIGIFTDDHIEPLRRIVDAVHSKATPIFIQLTHGGRKSWPEVISRLVAPSPIGYDDFYGVPEEMTKDDIRHVIAEYRAATKRSLQAGFDGIELHMAHGHLLHQFLSPLSNQRTDEYGGSLENRLRIIREVLEAIRGEVGSEYPVQVRVSASDFAERRTHPSGCSPSVDLSGRVHRCHPCICRRHTSCSSDLRGRISGTICFDHQAICKGPCYCRGPHSLPLVVLCKKIRISPKNF